MDKCREEFELEWKSQYKNEQITWNSEKSIYVWLTGGYHLPANIAFHFWKASRESMKVIKLPTSRGECAGGDAALSKDDVIEAITSAGYKVEQ